MSLVHENPEQRVLLVFVDITGYTAFVKRHKTNWAHGQYVITTLMEGILSEVSLPLVVSKLEGDAVFLYAMLDDQFNVGEIKCKLFDFFKVFRKKLDEQVNVNACHCVCCDNIDKLSLKMIVHAGSALVYQIAGFKELSGPDVILLHRLSKNSVRIPSYLLLTKSCYELLSFDQSFLFQKFSESYDQFEQIDTYVHDVSEITKPVVESSHIGLLEKITSNMSKMFYAFLVMIGIKKSWFKNKYLSRV